MTLDQKQTEALGKIFVNGFFVEGYLFLEGAENSSDISIPMMGYFGDYASMPIFDNGSEIYTVFGMQNVLLSESFCQLVKTIADKTMACTDNSLRGWAIRWRALFQ